MISSADIAAGSVQAQGLSSHDVCRHGCGCGIYPAASDPRQELAAAMPAWDEPGPGLIRVRHPGNDRQAISPLLLAAIG